MARRRVMRGGGGARRRGGGSPRRMGLGQMLREANNRAVVAHARERKNRRLGRRAEKSVRAAIAATAATAERQPQVGWVAHALRAWIGVLLIAPVWITTWTFVAVLADTTVRDQFWTTAAFWYFATGGLLMTGWFLTGLLRPGFLYLYVLGHELTHIACIKLFGGRVGDWDATIDGGYVTTDKTNIVIALAPYFVPFWSVLLLVLYALLGVLAVVPPFTEKLMFWALGFTWAFHLLWTAWMIPRDQPDLREHGTFLSLMVIVLANVTLLAGLLCAASEHVTVRDFARVWLDHSGRAVRWLQQVAVAWPFGRG